MEEGYLQNIHYCRKLVILTSVKNGKCLSWTYVKMAYSS